MNKQLTCCGTDCNTCGCYGNICKGCNESEGKVFHAPKGKACPIYECSVNQKKLHNCSECNELPCSIWNDTRDPLMTDEEFTKSINNRIKVMRGQ